MARKKIPISKPSKAYLISFGDTMTALLAFFIVLNAFAKEQTGANMYAGTGSFMSPKATIALSGGEPGDRSRLLVPKKAPSPIYAVHSENVEKDLKAHFGPDEEGDKELIIDRQTEEFKRFLTNIGREFDVDELPPTRSQIVFDSFENLQRIEEGKVREPLQKDAIQLASSAITKLARDDFSLEIVVWARMPSKGCLIEAMDSAEAIRNQIDRSFRLNEAVKSRMNVSAKPWLFSNSTRPRISFVISRLDK